VRLSERQLAYLYEGISGQESAREKCRERGRLGFLAETCPLVAAEGKREYDREMNTGSDRKGSEKDFRGFSECLVRISGQIIVQLKYGFGGKKKPVGCTVGSFPKAGEKTKKLGQFQGSRTFNLGRVRDNHGCPMREKIRAPSLAIERAENPFEIFKTKSQQKNENWSDDV